MPVVLFGPIKPSNSWACLWWDTPQLAFFLLVLSARERLTSSRPDAISVTPLPNQKFKSPSAPHLHQVSSPKQPSGDVRRAHKLNVSKRDLHLVNVKYCEDVRSEHQLEASRKQHEILCKGLKAWSHPSHQPSWCGRLYLYLQYLYLYLQYKTIWKSSALILKKIKKLENKKPMRLLLKYMLTLCFMHTNWLPEALLKKPVALKVLIWNRRRLVTLHFTLVPFLPWRRRRTALQANVSPFFQLM